MTRVAKLFRLACKFYELGNGDYLSVFSHPLIESAIVADYLMRKGDEAVEDFRRWSYKDTLRIFRDSDSGSEFFDTAAGQGVLRSAHADLALEGLSRSSFGLQKRNRWRLEGKAFRRIFEDVMGEDLYAVSYGASSESVHGSWQDIHGYSLQGDAAEQGFYPL